jgi:signal transduction histidine kinase
VADFLSALIHELRTPLTALRGSLGLMAGALPDDAEEARSFADIASRNSARLAALLDDVAAFARLELPETRAEPAALDLGMLLEQAAERVQAVAEGRSVTIEVQLPALDAYADEALLRDGVARMLFYAVRVTPRDGRVTLSAEPVGDRVVVRVTDEGRPLRDEDLPRFFEPFSPVARRGVDSADRAMLDLAIAKGIAERHGGAIEYRQLTAGGVVRLTLGAGSVRQPRAADEP